MFGRRKKGHGGGGREGALLPADRPGRVRANRWKRFWPAAPRFWRFTKSVARFASSPLLIWSGWLRTNAIQVIGISQDDASATRGFMQRFGVTFPTLLDLVERRLSREQRLRNHIGSFPVSAGTRRHHRSSLSRIFETRSRRNGRASRRCAVRPRRSRARMESRLRLQKLGPVWA